MKTVHHYQEIGHVIDAGTPVAFTCYSTVYVSVQCKKPPLRTVEIQMSIYVGDTCVGIAENTYPSMIALLEAFQIDDLAEIWEVLE